MKKTQLFTLIFSVCFLFSCKTPEVAYSTIPQFTTVEKIGLLAQDIQKIFPELVNESGDDQGILSINYQGLVPILINAIKEQQKELKELKEEILNTKLKS